jgi:hypothetical protein
MTQTTISSGGSIDETLRAKFGWTPYRVIGGLALASCAVVLLCDVTMWFLVEGYSPVSQTISELGAGPHQEVQDTGITIFAVGILILAGGLTLRGRSSKAAMAVRIAFVLLALDISAIALWNEYGDGDRGGLVLHRYFLIALYILVGIILLFAPAVTPDRTRGSKNLSRAAGIAWILGAPLFYVVPDSWNGAYERLLGILLVASVGIAAFRLFRKPEGEV